MPAPAVPRRARPEAAPRGPPAARDALARRGVDPAIFDEALELDERRRAILPELEELRGRRTGLEADRRSPALGAGCLRRDRRGTQRIGPREGARRGAEVSRGAPRGRAALPNLPDPSAPPADEVLREVGEAGAEGRDHVELLGDLVDLEAGARVAGSRFAYLKGPVVRLQFALVQWASRSWRSRASHRGAAGADPRAGALRHRHAARHRAADIPRPGGRPVPGRHLGGAARLASRRRDPRPGELPLRYAGISTCFRREAGAAGKDTRGIFRVHQFDKVEMFSFVEPDRSVEEHERLLSIEEEILGALELPYRVVNIAVDDLGASRRRSTTWRPGCRGRDASASSPRPPTRPTSRPAASTSASGPPRARRRGTSTR